jgi:hypothetical protein
MTVVFSSFLFCLNKKKPLASGTHFTHKKRKKVSNEKSFDVLLPSHRKLSPMKKIPIDDALFEEFISK